MIRLAQLLEQRLGHVLPAFLYQGRQEALKAVLHILYTCYLMLSSDL